MTEEEINKKAEKHCNEVLCNAHEKCNEVIKCRDWRSRRAGFFCGYEQALKDFEKENAELKGIKDVATLIKANNDTVITLMQLNNMLVSKNQQLTKAKEIIKKLQFLYLSPVVTKDDVKRQDETLAEVKQFLKSEVDK